MFPLTASIPGFTPHTPLRFTMYVSFDNPASNYDQVVLGFTPTTSSTSVSNYVTSLSWVGSRQIGYAALDNNTVIFNTGIADATTKVVSLTLPTGIFGDSMFSSRATYNKGDGGTVIVGLPSGSAHNPVYRFNFTTRDMRTYKYPYEWCAFILVGRAGSPTVYTASVGHIRLEYLS
jgi:hypothetical protein